MEYTIIRNIERNGKWNQYNYLFPELPKLSASTNYHRNIEKAIWYAEYDNKWRVEQNNSSLIWAEFIPIVNFFVAFFHQRIYSVFCNDICVGNSDKVWLKGKIEQRRRFVINGKEYFVNNGNTRVGWPMKEYEWSIERQEGQICAIVKKPSGKSIYKLEVLDDELNIEIIVIMIMMCDIHWFSGEDDLPINSNFDSGV